MNYTDINGLTSEEVLLTETETLTITEISKTTSLPELVAVMERNLNEKIQKSKFCEKLLDILYGEQNSEEGLLLMCERASGQKNGLDHYLYEKFSIGYKDNRFFFFWNWQWCHAVQIDKRVCDDHPEIEEAELDHFSPQNRRTIRKILWMFQNQDLAEIQNSTTENVR
ncbi:hypothetical protein COB64_00225 [Candidatus Wolfebacteria bacterium]|nr:MAG: hypothetical protein COB64_00225 [Candidatus Wolfebacteria bacterium]